MRFVAGRDAVAELLARGNVAKSHREDVAGRGAVAELLVRAAGESSWLGALRQRAIGKLLLAGAP